MGAVDHPVDGHLHHSGLIRRRKHDDALHLRQLGKADLGRPPIIAPVKEPLRLIVQGELVGSRIDRPPLLKIVEDEL